MTSRVDRLHTDRGVSAESWLGSLRGMRFQGEDFQALRGPLVYLALAEDDSPLYIGMSVGGIGRLFSRHHHAWKDHPVNEIAYVLVYPVGTKRDARALETCLIQDLKPRWNRAHITDFAGIADRLGMTVMATRDLGRKLRESHNERV